MLTRSIVTEPTGTEPSGTEPTGVPKMFTDPTGTEPTGTDATGTEPTGTEATGAPLRAAEVSVAPARLLESVQLIGGPRSHAHQAASGSAVTCPSGPGTGTEASGVAPRPTAAGVSEPSAVRERSTDASGAAFNRAFVVAFARTSASVTFWSGLSANSGTPARIRFQDCGGVRGIVESAIDARRLPPTEATGTEPRGTDPTGTDPSGTDPSGTDASGTEPTGTEPTGAEVSDDTAPKNTDGGMLVSGTVPAAVAVAGPFNVIVLSFAYCTTSFGRTLGSLASRVQ